MKIKKILTIIHIFAIVCPLFAIMFLLLFDKYYDYDFLDTLRNILLFCFLCIPMPFIYRAYIFKQKNYSFVCAVITLILLVLYVHYPNIAPQMKMLGLDKIAEHSIYPLVISLVISLVLCYLLNFYYLVDSERYRKRCVQAGIVLLVLCIVLFGGYYISKLRIFKKKVITELVQFDFSGMDSAKANVLIGIIKKQNLDHYKTIFPWEDVFSSMNKYPNEVILTSDDCDECQGKLLQIHFLSPEWTWRELYGREGRLIICPNCPKQQDFMCEIMN